MCVACITIITIGEYFFGYFILESVLFDVIFFLETCFNERERETERQRGERDVNTKQIKAKCILR